MLKKSLPAIFAFCCLIASQTGLATNAKNVSMLFVQTAHAGKITQASKNNYRVVLKDVSPYVTYFSDRPNRITGVMPLQKFLKVWDKGSDSLSIDHPNVGIQAILDATEPQQNNQMITSILTLSNPRYDAENKTLTYDAKTLNKNESIPNQQLKYVALFIDNLPINFGGGGRGF